MAENMLIFDIIIGMLMVSGLSMACLGLYGRRFADRIPAAVPYTLLMISAAAWALLLAVELLTGSLPLKILFHNLRFLFLPFIAVFELWLVIAFVKRTEWLRKDWAIAVLIIPVAAALLGITSPLHTLFRYNFSINSSGPVTVLQFTESPFFSLYILYSLVLLIIAMAILIVESRKRKTLWHEQTILLLIALGFPTVINYLFVFGVTPLPGVNMTAPLLWIAAVLYTVALFRYRFLDIIPIARSRLIDSMGMPMLVLDNDGRIIDLNPAASSLISVPAGKARSLPIAEVIADWPGFLELCGENRTCTYNLSRGAGVRERFYFGSVELLLTHSGEPEGRLILLQDVTDLKMTERALRESEKKFSLAFRSSPYAITISRLSDGVILDANDGFGQISGYALTDVIGKQVPALDLWTNPADRDAVIRDIQNGIRVAGREYRFRTRSGRIITGLYSAEVITIRDAAYLLSSINDITDRKQAEEQRELLIRELERKNAELDRFTHTVSHDLKSPLLTIRGFLALLEEDLEKNDMVQAKSDIGRIAHAAESMDRLIATLLELSRSGRSVDMPVRIPISDLAQEAAGLLATTLTDHHVTLVIADTLPEVSGDRVRLLQVMTNLLDNAVKFMGDQKEPRVEIGVRNETAPPVFFVRDNGSGMKKENLAKAFALFERFNPDVPGTGIGLATVKRIIEAHSGKVWAESEGPGKGTTFRFTLPGVRPQDGDTP